MSQRSADERIQALKDAGVELLSYSKMSTINSCLYSAWRTYILHDRGSDNCYSWAGTVCHDSLELLENDKITETDLLPALRPVLPKWTNSVLSSQKAIAEQTKSGNATLPTFVIFVKHIIGQKASLPQRNC